jgi:hypothetical protein
MKGEQYDAHRVLEELRRLLESERNARWFVRFGLRNIILAKIRYRLPSLYRGMDLPVPSVSWKTELRE